MKKKIDDLLNKTKLIKGWQRVINEEAYESEKRYDMTYGGNFIGNLESKAEEFRDDLCKGIQKGQNGTSQLLLDIQRIIDTLRIRIDECRRRISKLEDELENLS